LHAALVRGFVRRLFQFVDQRIGTGRLFGLWRRSRDGF